MLTAPPARALIYLLILSACGPRVAAAGEDGSEDPSETETIEDLPSPTDLPNPEPPLCDCEPGATCVLTSTDGGCWAGCYPLPESCGDAPSCDPACNWDLCKHVSCYGPVESAEWCWHVDDFVTGWGCSQGMICNPWLQDCPEGETCRPYSGGGDDEWWLTNRCHYLADALAAVGEPCERSGDSYSGEGNCEGHAICWHVDPDTNLGTCIPLCAGAPHDPICPEGSACVLAEPMYAAFCLPPCDPFGDACGPGYQCTMVADTLACMPSILDPASEGEPCEHPNSCGPALACVDATCTQLCHVDAPACPPEAPTCTPAQTNMPNIGVCTT